MAMDEAVSDIRKRIMSVESKVTHFGWDESCQTFVLGNDKFTADGAVTPIVSMSPTLQTWGKALGTGGSMEGWKAAVGVFDRPEYRLCQMLLGISMAVMGAVQMVRAFTLKP